VIALVDSNSDPSVLSHPIPGNDDSTKSIRIIVDVILDAIQTGLSNRVQAPTKRKDITPVAQEPDFLENEDEPEVTLPEGYDEMDFDDRKKQDDSEVEADVAEAKVEPKASDAAPSDGEENAEQEAVATKE
jgi:small subunit ribosomal protein S2